MENFYLVVWFDNELCVWRVEEVTNADIANIVFDAVEKNPDCSHATLIEKQR